MIRGSSRALVPIAGERLHPVAPVNRPARLWRDAGDALDTRAAEKLQAVAVSERGPGERPAVGRSMLSGRTVLAAAEAAAPYEAPRPYRAGLAGRAYAPRVDFLA